MSLLPVIGWWFLMSFTVLSYQDIFIDLKIRVPVITDWVFDLRGLLVHHVLFALCVAALVFGGSIPSARVSMQIVCIVGMSIATGLLILTVVAMELPMAEIRNAMGP